MFFAPFSSVSTHSYTSKCKQEINSKAQSQKSEKRLLYIYTELFISLSGLSELDCATTKTDTAERSIAISRESLQVFFFYKGLGVLPGSTARG